MNTSKVLITGGYGCIGAETTKWFLNNTDASVIICSRQVSEERTRRVFHDVETNRLESIPVDISKMDEVSNLFHANAISHVIHLAALQTPDCDTHRDLGLQVNLAGTQNLIEAMKVSRSPIERFVFASSIAVYGPRANYAEGLVPSDSEPLPVNPYGVWKLAGENLSRIFHEDTGVPTVCLRPAVLYGPGRDIGLTSTPTTAMKHLVCGLPYQIPFCSRQDFQFAPDVGAATALSAWESFANYGVFTLPSHTLESQQIVEVISNVASEIDYLKASEISVGDERVPFICDLEFKAFLSQFPGAPHTSIEDGIRRTLETFHRQHQAGWLRIES